MPARPRAMRRWAFAGLAGVAILLAAITLRPHVRGLTLVVRAADVQGPIRRVADINTVRISERLIEIPIDGASIRARVYAPVKAARHTALLVSGLHPTGIDEPRLVVLARMLAEANVTVVTPDIPELSRYEIAPALTDQIEDSAAWLAAQPGLTPRGRIGLMGISFSGGLVMVAAGRASLRDRLLYVFSLGGHDDLRRVVEYYCNGLEPDGSPGSRPASDTAKAAPPPHDYGVAVVLLTVAARVVPPAQVAPLQDAVRRFLWASYLDRFDKPQAAREFAALRAVALKLPEPSATLLGYVNDRDVKRLGPILLPHIGLYVDARELSPSRSPGPQAPVFLLHGTDDNVIPALESQHLADRLRGRVPVHLLLTDLISHAEADRPVRMMDLLKLAAFWGDLLEN